MQPVHAASLDVLAPFEELSAGMCRAQGPSQALVLAAAAVPQQVPSLVFCGLAVAAQDRQSVRYSRLHAARQGAARLAAVPAASCAAGIAIGTKQVVHVRDISLQGDLGLHDLQYLQQEHQARSCFVAPLVVAGNALGALSMAASQADAFVGHEAWLLAVAALCAPYMLLLKSHEGLLALEGLASQMLPMRVAMQLQDQQRRSSHLLEPLDGYEQQLLPLRGTHMTAASAGPSSALPADAAADSRVVPASGAGLLAVQQEAAADGGLSIGSSSLRQLRAAQRLRHQQPQGNLEATSQMFAPQPVQSGASQAAQQRQQQPQQQLGLVRSWRRSRSMAFQQPHLEQAFRQWALQQWVRLLDSIFLCLVLLSACSGLLTKGWFALHHALLQQQQRNVQRPWLQAGGFIQGMGLLLLLLTAILWLLRCMQRLPAAQYLVWRRPALVALRVLRTLLFCVELGQLGPKLSHALLQQANGMPSVASGSRQGGRDVGGPQQTAAAAGVGLLLMLGLLGQLPFPQHAAVQGVCVTFVLSVLCAVHAPGLPTAAGLGDVASVLLGVVGGVWVRGSLLVVLGWLLPVVAIAALEWFARKRFLEKIS